MIAYKGFTKELTARLGQGDYRFRPEGTFEEKLSKTAKSGFHCCENPFECLGYYNLGTKDRFFQVEAAGSIDEDGAERIACTKITLIKELGIKEFAGHGMMYIVRHPLREKWQQSLDRLLVAPDKAEAQKAGGIAIARGKNPKVRGPLGSVLGLIAEPEPGNITAAKLFVAGPESGTKGATWYTLKEDRTLQEVWDEAENN